MCTYTIFHQFIVNLLFSGTNVSQGSVATYARCGETQYNPFTANFLENIPVLRIADRLRILRFDRIMAIGLVYSFLAHPVARNNVF